VARTFTPVRSLAFFCLAVTLTGCGLSNAPGAIKSAAVPPASGNAVAVSGLAYGGQQPITCATMTLWAAGAPSTGGSYGSGATSLATTVTDQTGGFNFENPTACITDYAITSNVATFTSINSFTAGETLTLSGFSSSTFFNGQTVTVLSTGLSSTQFEANFTYADTSTTTENGTATGPSIASACTTGQYLYVTSQGGDTGSLTPNTTVNSKAALLAGIPQPCGPSTASTFLVINEVSTVATVWSLQQFMSIAATGTPWQIGAPSTNLKGLANAFTQIGELEDPNYGGSTIFATYSQVNGVNYTTTITPDTQRINALANVLADCVNTYDSAVNTASATCSSLFSDTTPSGGITPADTIQVAYNIATNPAMLTMPTHSPSATSYLCSHYAPPQAPFASTLNCTTTNDYLIGVSWKTVGGGNTTGTVYAGTVAVDSNGNIWVGAANGVATASGYINQFNPAGQLAMAPVTSVSIPANSVYYVAGGTGSSSAFAGATGITPTYSNAAGLALDTNNNAWYGSYFSTSPAGILSNGLDTGLVIQVTPSGTATGFLAGYRAGGLAVDGNNNVYVADYANNTTARYTVSELLASANWLTVNEGGTATTNHSTHPFQSVFIDQSASQFSWGFDTTCTSAIARDDTAEEASGAATSVVTSGSICGYYGAADASNNAFMTGGGSLSYINISSSLSSPTVTTLTGSTNTSATGTAGTGGLDLPQGLALDGAGNIWTVNNPATTVAGGLSEFSVSTVGTTTTFTPLSPGGSTAGVFGFQIDGAENAGDIAIDGSGNIWIGTASNSYLYHMVGAAAPVVTPTSLAIKNTKLGVRP